MSNVGYATLSIIPSAKGFLRNLRQETKGPLESFGKEIAEALSSQVAEAIGGGLDDVNSAGLGRRIREETSTSTERGLREGVDKGAGGIEDRLRSSVNSAFRDGFKRGFRGLFNIGQDQDQSLRRSLAFGVAGGILQGARDGFSAARESVKTFASNVNETLTAAGKTALSAISGAITATAGTAATGGLNLLLGLVLAIAAAIPGVLFGFLALAPVLSLVGGLIGSTFTIAFGGAATLGVLALATRGLSDAFKELSEDGKVSNETLKKLAPSAVQFVQAIAKVRKPFGDLAKFVQGKFFSGLVRPFETLTTRWLPALRPMLGGLATQLGTVAKSALKALSDTTFIDNIRVAVAGFGAFVARIGESLGPLIGAFGRLAAASVPFLAHLGERIGSVIEKFSAWIATAEKSGALASFMQTAARSLQQMWQIGGLAVGILGEIVKILFPKSAEVGGTFLDGVVVLLQKVKTWLADPKNQQAIRDFISKLQEFASKAVNEWAPAVVSFFSRVASWVARIEGWIARFEAFRARVSSAINSVRTIVSAAVGVIVGAFGRLASPLVTAASYFTRFASAARTQFDRAVSFARSLPGRIVSALAGLAGQMVAAGRNAIAGFVNGLLGGLGSVRAAGSAIGKAALSAAKAALDVNSPSRKMRSLGDMTTKGYVVGMLRRLPEVKKTSAKLAAMAASGFKNRASSSWLLNAVPGSDGRITKSANAFAPYSPTGASVADVLASKQTAASSGDTHYHLHDSKATLGQLAALQDRQAITARAGRAR